MKKQPSLSTAFPGKRENPARGGAFGWIGRIALSCFLSALSGKEPVISQRQNLYAGSGGRPLRSAGVEPLPGYGAPVRTDGKTGLPASARTAARRPSCGVSGRRRFPRRAGIPRGRGSYTSRPGTGKRRRPWSPPRSRAWPVRPPAPPGRARCGEPCSACPG